MKITSLSAYHIRLPLKLTFSHNLAERSSSQSVLVKMKCDDGLEGWGECVPRDYVTGETPESVLRAYEHLNDIGLFDEFASFEEIIDFLGRAPLLEVASEGIRGNAAWCAVELALLDACCRRFRKTFAEVAALVLPADMVRKEGEPVRYSVGISAGPVAKVLLQAVKYRCFGFRDAKVKVGEALDADCVRLKWIRAMFGRRRSLRVDANACYSLGEALEAMERFQGFGVAAFEEPLRKDQRERLSELAKRSPVPLIIDESLCSPGDATRLLKESPGLILNVKISKVGGFIQACRIARIAAHEGGAVQLGCQVGESGILSAAGRLFAQTVKGIRYFEGSYDRYLLKDNIITGDISFGIGGVAKPLSGYGLCVDVDESKVKKLLVEERVYR
jgi:muconate cycloisomerase